MSNPKGRCVKCGKHRPLEQHHVLPRRWWGNKTETVKLCRQCHREADALTHTLDARILRVYRDVYILAFRRFLNS